LAFGGISRLASRKMILMQKTYCPYTIIKVYLLLIHYMNREKNSLVHPWSQ
jgi:hypothetical protein